MKLSNLKYYSPFQNPVRLFKEFRDNERKLKSLRESDDVLDATIKGQTRAYAGLLGIAILIAVIAYGLAFWLSDSFREIVLCTEQHISYEDEKHA